MEKDRRDKIRVVYEHPGSGKILLDTRSGWTKLFEPNDEPHLATHGSHVNTEKGVE
jgi:hypothetical protein